MSRTLHQSPRGIAGALLLLALLPACGSGTQAPAVPEITTQPSDQSVMAGMNASFSVAATGESLAYQWQSSPSGAAWIDVSGATSATLTLAGVVVTDSGKRVRAVVSNSAGSATSSVATLTVNAAPAGFKALTPTLTVARVNAAATLLANGQVLITGGFSTAVKGAPVLGTAELYDATANTFTPLAGMMQSVRCSHTSTLLPSGKVLLAGGQVTNNGDGRNTAELYDPTTQTFAALPAVMVSPRGGHAATLLPDGKVLLVGGFDNSADALDSAEVFDPATQTFSAVVGAMTSRREGLTATLLPDGAVLLAGGSTSHVASSSAELFDPASQTFMAIPATMAAPRESHTATLLPDGLVLVAGGGVFGEAPPSDTVVLGSAELYDPAAQAFAATAATMTSPRFGHTATLLTSGSLLLVGGAGLDSRKALYVLNTAEVYGP